MKKYIVSVCVSVLIFIISGISTTRAATSTENLLIIFDASGSMTTQFGGVTRISAAQSTISDLVQGLDTNTLVGLRALAQENKSLKADACKETALLQPFTSDHQAIVNQVNSLQAVGSYTPLAYALRQSASDFTSGQNNVLILMTDGQENCGGDPAAAAAALKAAGIKVKTYVIGLGADPTMRSQLSSIATAGGGTYYDASDATSLASSFNAIQQAEHPIDKTNTDSLLGTEVTGGNGYETAVPITPGMYHLSHDQIGEQYDYFKMNVNAGEKVNYSVQSSESNIDYDKKTNTFISRNDHAGDCALVKVYSATRAKIDSVYALNPSQLVKGSFTPDETGTIYFFVGCSSVMAKSDIFTIAFDSPATSSPSTQPQTVADTSSGQSPSGTDSQTGSSNGGNIQPQTAHNQPSMDTPPAQNLIYIIIVAVIIVGILLIALIVLVIVLIKRGKTKNIQSPNVTPTESTTPPPPVQPMQ